MKNQDIVVLAVLMKDGASRLSYQGLSHAAKISVSEAHASVKRLLECNLINSERNLKKRNVEEFLFHGLRYIFPMKSTGEMIYGMPTAYAAPVSADAFAVHGNVPVWKNSSGNVLGRACEPIYPSAPEAAANDPDIYNKLAIVDMLRGGRLRERKFAEEKIKELMA
jgi:hypothetical protein